MPRKKDPAKVNTVPRQKVFLYKHATYAVEPYSKTLEDILDEVWTATSAKSGQRRQIMDEQNHSCVVTHYRTKLDGMTFFEILAFTPGMKALAAKIDFSRPSIDVEQVEVRNTAGQMLELIQNMVHIGVSKNDVVLLPSTELRSQDVEGHLNWLLTSAAPVLKNGQKLRLSNHVPANREEEVKSAKAIHFSTDLSIAAETETSGQKFLRPEGKSWAGIKALLESLGGKMVDVTSDLETNGLTESTPVEIDIFLKWPRTREKSERHMMLDKIATGLRHLDTEIDYEIKTKNGKMTKADFILQRTRTVHCTGERPVRDLLFKSMAKWLVELHSTGQIA